MIMHGFQSTMGLPQTRQTKQKESEQSMAKDSARNKEMHKEQR